MTTNERSTSRKLLLTLATLLLWAITVVLGAYSVKVLLDTAIFILEILPLFGLIEQRVALAGMMSAATWIVTVAGGILWLVVTVGGLEYHFKRIGRPESWRLFAWTIGLELTPILLSFIIPEAAAWLLRE